MVGRVGGEGVGVGVGVRLGGDGSEGALGLVGFWMGARVGVSWVHGWVRVGAGVGRALIYLQTHLNRPTGRDLEVDRQTDLTDRRTERQTDKLPTHRVDRQNRQTESTDGSTDRQTERQTESTGRVDRQSTVEWADRVDTQTQSADRVRDRA